LLSLLRGEGNDADEGLLVVAMETVRDKMASRQQDLKLYLEYINPDTKADVRFLLVSSCVAHSLTHVSPHQWQRLHGTEPPIMIFVKNFDVAHQTLAGCGHFYVHRHMRVMDLALMINERMGFPATTPLKIYEVRRTLGRVVFWELTLAVFYRRSNPT
jgi:ubiquitin carboxyl-terminal hydrolase 7